MGVQIVEREDGSRRVSITFDETVKEIRRKSGDRKSQYEYFPERSRTKPEFQKDANINRIMKKYKRTGILGDPLAYRDMHYGDFANGNDFAEMAIKVADAQQEFLSLSAEVRNRFQNDPSKLLDFLADPRNDEEAIKLGLKEKPKITKETKDGFRIVYKDGVEIFRNKIEAPAAGAPAAAGAAAGSSPAAAGGQPAVNPA